MTQSERPEIRLATPDDLPALHGMALQLAAHRDEMPRDAATLHRDAFILPGTRVLVARGGNNTMGYVLMRLTRDPISWASGYEITDLFVAPAHRNRGLGRRLVGAARLLAEAEGRATLSITPTMAALSRRLGAARALPLALA
ncbi:GNAT family N-acetyltransferase [Paragemmobacter ruber]|uniref:GNAT family N-acetyltransferase n=1 Tax=Paragemmobacter ruber TaxID=1985673 RepID=A0ABW9Y543_9RHOB|nr:GNAT family N-acetyltransferase [Rhodobacter ruber]NBE07629.1 GNAT family N-acetyltransferase [Rhodobacter ruber]